MTPELGQMVYEPETATFLAGATPMLRPRTYADGTAAAIDHAIKDLIEAAFRTARDILERNEPVLRAATQELLERETLATEDLARLAADLKKAGPDSRLKAAAG